MSELRTRKRTWMERKGAVTVVLIVLFVVLLGAVIVIWKLRSFIREKICTTKECVEAAYFLLELIDSKVDPCDHFYNFTCGNYTGELVVKNFQASIDMRVRNFIIEPIEDKDYRSVKLQKKYYQACMNLTAIEEVQNETLKKLFGKLGGWPILVGEEWNKTQFDWGRIVDKCKDLGLYYDWFINVDSYEYENRLNVTAPSNVNEIEPIMRKKYVELMTYVVKMLGSPGHLPEIIESMTEVMEFEIELSKIIEESNSNETEYSVEDIRKKFPDLPWSAIFKNVILPKHEKVVFNVDDYLSKLMILLNVTPKQVQANYIFWKLTESFSAFLTHNVRKEFKLYSSLSSHYEYPTDRQDYCFRITSTVFGYVSEAEYVRNFVAERKSVQDMVDRIKSVLYDHIENAKWMSQSDKSLAFFKLKSMRVIIGGPDEMYDEEEFDKFLGIDQIDLSNLETVVEILCEVDKSRDLYNLDFVKPRLTLDQARLYHSTVYIGSIKYLPDENTMFLPAAALDGLLYSQNLPLYANYGLLGTVIGHEMSHGFGIEGNTVYEEGDANILWTNYTNENFLTAADCLLKNCNNIWIEDNIWMSCRDTFEESFADHVGINLSYEAYVQLQRDIGEEKSLPGLTYTPTQLFWISYASIMCNNLVFNITESHSHMLPFQRIVGAFQNTDYFAQDFSCPVGSNMNPIEKCKIL